MRRVLAALGVAALCSLGPASAQSPSPAASPRTATSPAASPTAATRADGVATKEVTYAQGGTEMQGFMAWPAGAKDKRPGVIVVHEWWGHNQHARDQAVRLAQAGYVGFALDMFGKGRLATHPQQAQEFVKEATRDAAVMMARFEAARALLEKDPHVDPTRMAAIGYCFGGAVVLAAARAGHDLDAVATFHGSIGTEQPAQPGKVKARILVMTGGADPMVPPEQVEKFKKEMEAAGARHEVIVYPSAKHSFTNKDAEKAGMPGLAYDVAADRESWAALLKMLREVFGA